VCNRGRVSRRSVGVSGIACNGRHSSRPLLCAAAGGTAKRRAMMYNSYIMRRTQIYLDERQAEQLARRARARGTTASKMIREAIDEYLAGPDDAADRRARFQAALDASFGVAPDLADGATYVDDLRRIDRVREEDLRAGADR
jgi:Ribbon-helix-helix protein, copG family